MTAAILNVRLVAAPGIVSSTAAKSDLARLFDLDRLAVRRQTLVCRWHRDADGRLSCTWEPDIGLLPRT